MAIRNIVQFGEEILTKKCKLVDTFDSKLWLILDDMRETLYDADGAGLAAPQIGILRRYALVDLDDVFLELINPVITSTEGENLRQEGCLSVSSSLNCLVKRPQKVTVKYQDRFGKECTYTGEDMVARAICHELDHLDGVLFFTHKYNPKNKE